MSSIKNTMSWVETVECPFVYVLSRFRRVPFTSWSSMNVFPRNPVIADTIAYYPEGKWGIVFSVLAFCIQGKSEHC